MMEIHKQEKQGCISKNQTIPAAFFLSLLMIVTPIYAQKISQAEEEYFLVLTKRRVQSRASSGAAQKTREKLIPEDTTPAHLRNAISAGGVSRIEIASTNDGSDRLGIRNLHNRGQLRGSWPLDEGNQIIFDKTENCNDGWLGELVGLDGSDPAWKRLRGRTSVFFDATNDFLRIPDSFSLEPPTVGVQVWVKGGPQSRVNKYIMGKGADNGCASYALYTAAGTDGAPGMTFYISDGDCQGAPPGTFTETPRSKVTDEFSVWNWEWQQVVGFFDGSCVAIYVNGVFGGATAVDEPIDYNKPITNDLYFGNFGASFDTGDFAYGGELDDVQVGTSEPLAVPTGPQVVRVGTNSKFDGSHSFLGMQYRWEFGDGRVSNAKKPFHVFKRPGIYNVCLTINADVEVLDICENLVVHDTHCMKVLVYDPKESRKISGWGKIHSPIGAYRNVKGLVGYASFIFNAPEGPSEFTFERGNLNLKWKSYAWYIVGRQQAVLQGTGYLHNGYAKKAANFKIFVTTAPRRTFRIMIEELGGYKKDVYDSGVQVIAHGGNLHINSNQ